ncbi:SNF2 family N-terminal domain-containing protein [Fomitopsis serialis]|uniref:SNF2 family N-terminal domain-containing protein n=1 Tax=Fomitopsis serialis TaxID=139415 RepID=UPI0020086927|nr:SNF2 family N-terminal domain-containing protein [Neoantrodia serialis]KAH9938679.1 SNF2 family N-terminal domain-containing protein [Neoantrodia serialis]
MPRPRRTTRSEASVSVTPASATVSPGFSARSSKQSTPATSVVDEVEKPAAQPRRSARKSIVESKKRARETDEEAEDKPSKTGTKRRVVAREVYVEIQVSQKKSAATTTQSSSKGARRTAATKTPAVKAEESVDEVGDSEEDRVSILESDDSGSEYEASDIDSAPEDAESDKSIEDYVEPAVKDEYTAEGIDDEDVMMDAAIQASLESARQDDSRIAGTTSAGAGSSKQRPPVNSAAALRAAAAERRLAKEQDGAYSGESLSEPADSEDELPLAKSKGKAKVSTALQKLVDTSEPKYMTLAQRRHARKLARMEKSQVKSEEQRMRYKLGRKLTYAEKSTIALQVHHPELKDVWGNLERRVAIVEPKKAKPPAGIKVTLLPFQEESLYWMREQEKGEWKGGMLADEMGMGKTIQMIALLASDAGVKPNLVIAPTVAIMQWRNEIETHTDSFKVLVWHGSSRDTNVKTLKSYDVVLTTYAVLESCFRKQENGFKRKGKIIKEKSPVHQVHWHRIILDEAHNIKERSTNTAKAAFELQGTFRWCLSGTPLQNRVGELYSLVRFLGGDPFSYYFCKSCPCKSLHWRFSDKRSCDDCGHSPMKHTCLWNNEILTPIQKNGMVGPGETAFKKLKILLDRMMLRRTKLQRADDLGLPPRTVIVRRDYFSPEEKELYLSLFSDAKRQFNTYVDSGTVLNNYSNIFSLLTRMRQMACHPDLVLRSKSNAGTFLQDDQGEATVCRLCNEIAEDAIQAKCRHIYDRECIKQYLNTAIEVNPACPVCHVPLTIDLDAPALDLEENAKPRQGILGRLELDKWRSSSKIEALIEELDNLRRQDCTTKSIVFSQFVNFLDLIAYRLQKAGFVVCRLEGTMSPQARDATIQHFMNNVHVTVFLVSLKAGGVALNLTEASRVFLMDSWWNPAVEYQAMDRIHRLGQHRPVEVVKLVVEDSIESKIVQLQEKKAAMVDATLSTDDSAMGRLTPEDLGFLFRVSFIRLLYHDIVADDTLQL